MTRLCWDLFKYVFEKARKSVLLNSGGRVFQGETHGANRIQSLTLLTFLKTKNKFKWTNKFIVKKENGWNETTQPSWRKERNDIANLFTEWIQCNYFCCPYSKDSILFQTLYNVRQKLWAIILENFPTKNFLNL